MPQKIAASMLRRRSAHWLSRSALLASLLAALLLLAPGTSAANPPATQLEYGFEPGDTATFNDVRIINVVDAPVHLGNKAMQAGATAYRGFATSTALGQPTAYRMYTRWTEAPSSGTAQIAWALSHATSKTSFTVRVDPAGRVSLRDANGRIRGESAPLAPDAWHLIEFIVTQTESGAGVGSLRVNDTAVATDQAGSFNTVAVDRLRVGQIGSIALPDVTHDDVAVSQPGGSWLGSAAPPPPPPPPPPQTAQFAYGFEQGEPGPFFQDAGSSSIVGEPVHAGSRALQPSQNAYRSFHTTTSLGQSTAYRLYAYWSAPPSSGAAQIAWVLSDPAPKVTSFTLRVDAQSRISLRDRRGAIRAQTGPMSNNTWHLVEARVTQASDGLGSGSLRVNGGDVATDVAGDYGSAAVDRFRTGLIGSIALPGITLDDVAVSQPDGSWLGPTGN